MGIAQAGLVYRAKHPVSDFRHFVTQLLGEEVAEVPHPDVGKFDIRNHSDVMVQVFGDVCFVCNNDLVWTLLENPSQDFGPVHSLIGRPDLMVAFCHYDSGGSHGYAIVEHGKRIRTRLQTTEVPRLPPLIEMGAPMVFEKDWLSAPFYFEDDDDPTEDHVKVYYRGNREVLLPEQLLTRQLLFECLVSLFGVCPWETSLVPEYHFFRLTPKKKPWWKLR